MPLFLKRRAPQILPTAAAMIEKRRNESSNRWQLRVMLPLENNIVNALICKKCCNNIIDFQYILVCGKLT